MRNWTHGSHSCLPKWLGISKKGNTKYTEKKKKKKQLLFLTRKQGVFEGYTTKEIRIGKGEMAK